MLASGSEEEADTMLPRVMSQEALKKMFEAKVKELEKARDKGKKGECDSDEEKEGGVEGGTLGKEVELPVDQKEFVESLNEVIWNSLGGKDDVPIFCGA